jgi:hypothetical protein
MTSEAPDSLTPRARLPPASRVLVAALVCLLLATPGAVAQSRYSALVAVGFGAVPAERRHASVAGSVVLFRRLGPAADLGLEVGYQHFGAAAQEDVIGFCPILPAGACVGQITADRRAGGDLWFVGPTVRLRVVRQGALRPFVLIGLGRYGSGEHTIVTYRDDRGVTVPNPAPLPFDRTFGGVGVNAAVGIEGAGLGRLRWILMARAHGAVGGMSGEMASVSAYTVTARLTLR